MLEKSWWKLDKSTRNKDSSFPMDFLQTFVCDGGGCGGYNRSPEEETPEQDDVELSLGLSLNGRFGVERRRVVADNNYGDKNRLIRASSVADFMSFPSAGNDPAPLSVYPPLTRTCSLPVEAEEEWKKRKELQSLWRSAAKRKRVEKLKNVTVLKAEENCETKRRNLMIGNELWRSSPLLLPPPLPRPQPFPSQLSIGSPASGGSSGVSDLESQPFSGINKDIELKSTVSQQSVPYRTKSSGPYRSNKVDVAFEHASDKFFATSSQVINRNGSFDETLKTMLADMPCVSTKGDGVNGKRVEGFLYRYKKGEDVRIVCVCHGSFLTPAEFVKHGGGGDVERPLRHIVVNPPSLR